MAGQGEVLMEQRGGGVSWSVGLHALMLTEDTVGNKLSRMHEGWEGPRGGWEGGDHSEGRGWESLYTSYSEHYATNIKYFCC